MVAGRASQSLERGSLQPCMIGIGDRCSCAVGGACYRKNWSPSITVLAVGILCNVSDRQSGLGGLKTTSFILFHGQQSVDVCCGAAAGTNGDSEAVAVLPEPLPAPGCHQISPATATGQPSAENWQSSSQTISSPKSTRWVTVTSQLRSL